MATAPAAVQEHLIESQLSTARINVWRQASAAECFRRLDAALVVVAKGPGHQRDTQLVISETGLEGQLKALELRFIDLNRDELVKARLCATYTSLTRLWLPRTLITGPGLP